MSGLESGIKVNQSNSCLPKVLMITGVALAILTTAIFATYFFGHYIPITDVQQFLGKIHHIPNMTWYVTAGGSVLGASALTSMISSVVLNRKNRKKFSQPENLEKKSATKIPKGKDQSATKIPKGKDQSATKIPKGKDLKNHAIQILQNFDFNEFEINFLQTVNDGYKNNLQSEMHTDFTGFVDYSFNGDFTNNEKIEGKVTSIECSRSNFSISLLNGYNKKFKAGRIESRDTITDKNQTLLTELKNQLSGKNYLKLACTQTYPIFINGKIWEILYDKKILINSNVKPCGIEINEIENDKYQITYEFDSTLTTLNDPNINNTINFQVTFELIANNDMQKVQNMKLILPKSQVKTMGGELED